MSRYGGSLIDTEEKRMKRFRDNLDKELQKLVDVAKHATFAKMVNHAKELEEIDSRIDDQREPRQGPQKWTTFEYGGSSSKKGMFQAIPYH